MAILIYCELNTVKIKKIFAEQIYGEELLYGKVYKLHMDLGENKKILSKIYYDKDGNEIPKSELGISE